MRAKIVFITLFLLAFFCHVALSATPDNVVVIRSEGGCRIENANTQTAKDKAIQNAIRKALKSEVGDIVNLSKTESDNLLPKIESSANDYISGYEIKEEANLNGVMRIILDVQIIPDKLVGYLLNSLGTVSFSNKPRIFVILPEDQKPLSTAIEKGFVGLGFRVISSSGKEELKSYLEMGDIDNLTKTAMNLGGEVIITGECTYNKIEDKRLGGMVSWQNEASLKAIRCQDNQVLSAGNYKGVELSLNEQTGKRKASEKIAQEILKDFPQKIVKIWSTDLALGKIVLKPFPVNVEPPQLIIESPVDQSVTVEATARLSGSAKYNQNTGEIRLLINGSSLALDKDTHLTSDKNTLFFNRQIPLTLGENTISVSAIDQNGSRIDKIVKVIYDQSRKIDIPSVEIRIGYPLPNQNVTEESILVTGEVISSIPLKDQIGVTVNSKETIPFRGMKVKRNPEKENEQSIPINKQIFLTPGRNEIKVTVTTETDQKFKANVSVVYTPGSSTQSSDKKKFAVIIGINKYKNPDIESLKVAGVDANSIYQIITDPQGGGFAKENVKLLLDDQATREAITNTMGEWLPGQVRTGDTVLIFYSGHGGVEPDSTGEEPDGNSKYIIPSDADPGNLFSTAIQNSTITRMLQRVQSNQMVFLIDCCYSGGATTGQELVKSVSPPSTRVETDVYNELSGSGRVIISASLPDQVSFELPKLNHGIFTYNLLEGISGKADFNQDGAVSLISEMYPYLSREVSQMAHSLGFRQNPMLKCQVVGDIILSKVLTENK
jgi:hypothetical protein